MEEGAAGRWVTSSGHHKKIGFEVFDYGIIKRRIWSTTSEESSQWELGHPVLFPNILHQGGDGRYFLQFRVPIDDMTTWHLEYTLYWLPEWLDLPPQENIPVTYYPLLDERGNLRNDDILDQDQMAWVAQGDVMDRSLEHLGESDRGVILFRKLLQEQMAVVQDGGDPMCVIRDPAKNEYVHIPQEALRPLPLDADLDVVARYGSKLRQEFGELMKVASETALLTTGRRWAAGIPGRPSAGWLRDYCGRRRCRLSTMPARARGNASITNPSTTTTARGPSPRIASIW